MAAERSPDDSIQACTRQQAICGRCGRCCTAATRLRGRICSGIHTSERRLRAEQLVEQLEGMCHIRARPPVSATHLPGEHLAVTVHGRAIPIDVQAETGARIRQTLLDIYVPRYGPAWEEFLDSATVYARIEADRMFTFAMPEAEPTDEHA